MAKGTIDRQKKDREFKNPDNDSACVGYRHFVLRSGNLIGFQTTAQRKKLPAVSFQTQPYL
jgi:hypothetical protein